MFHDLQPPATRGSLGNLLDNHQTVLETPVHQANDPAQERDQEIEGMKTTMQNMNSKVHRAISSTPEIEHILEETQKLRSQIESSSP